MSASNHNIATTYYLTKSEIMQGGEDKFRTVEVPNVGFVRYRPLSHNAVISFMEAQQRTENDRSGVLIIMREMCEQHLADENGNLMFEPGELSSAPFDYVSAISVAIVQDSTSRGEAEGEESAGARTSGSPTDLQKN